MRIRERRRGPSQAFGPETTSWRWTMARAWFSRPHTTSRRATGSAVMMQSTERDEGIDGEGAVVEDEHMPAAATHSDLIGRP